MRSLCVLFAATILAFLPLLASAGEARLGDLVIASSWARASAGPAKTGAAYLSIINQGEAADRLVAVSSPRAAKAALHTNIIENDVVKMRPLEALELPPTAETKLAPGGHHIMLMGLAEPLREGESFDLTLSFAEAGEVTVEVEVLAVGAMGPE